MRVTQGMISNNSLNTISNSYSRLNDLYDEMSTGKKISKPSQDPVIAMEGVGNRVDLAQLDQYQRNVNTGMTWTTAADDALNDATTSIQRMRELLVQASNDTNTATDRTAIADELNQLIQHYQVIGNTKVGDQYIFNGTNTTKQPIDPTATPPQYPISTGYVPFMLQVGNGIQVEVSTNGGKIFDQNIFDTLNQMVTQLRDPSTTNTSITNMLTQIDNINTSVLRTRTDIGARADRVDMVSDRLRAQQTLATKVMSDNEDADTTKVIVDLKEQETIHTAALEVGARIMQPSLMDFLK